MPGTQVPPLVEEDPTCHGATWPMCHTTTEPTALEPMLRNKRSHHNKQPVRCHGEQPSLAETRESLPTATKTQRSQIYLNKYIFLKINKFRKNTYLNHTYSHMILEIIMNNPDRNKYMSKSKGTVSVCLIDLGEKKNT